jgi:hypothetical protein
MYVRTRAWLHAHARASPSHQLDFLAQLRPGPEDEYQALDGQRVHGVEAQRAARPGARAQREVLQQARGAVDVAAASDFGGARRVQADGATGLRLHEGVDALHPRPVHGLVGVVRLVLAPVLLCCVL